MSRFKRNVFNLSYLLLEENEQSLMTTFILTMLQFIQMIYFPFQKKLVQLWKNTKIATDIQQTLQVFSLLKYYVNSDLEVHLIILYIAFGIIISVILIGLYLSYEFHNYSRNKKLLFLLSFGLKFITSIGFNELLRIFLSFLTCIQTNDGNYKMYYIRDEPCWDINYIIHSLFAIISLILLLIIVIIYCLFFIDTLKSQKNTFSQKYGYTYIYFFNYVTISMISYSILQTPQYVNVIVLLQNITSFNLFFRIYMDKPFYNKIIQQLWLITTGITFYISFMLLISYYFSNNVITNILECTLICTPMIAIILLNPEKAKVNLLKANFSDNLTLEECLLTCEHLIYLIEHQENNKKLQFMLSGFVQTHKHSCLDSLCILKQKKHKTFLKQCYSEEKNDKCIIAQKLIAQLYEQTFHNYPSSVLVIIRQAEFLINISKQFLKARQILDQSQHLQKSYTQEFTIFRLQQIVENELISNTKQNFDMNENFHQTTQEIQKQFKLVENVAYLYQQFWCQLQEHKPNLAKLYQDYLLIQKLEHQIEIQNEIILSRGEINKKYEKMMFNYYQIIQNDIIQAEQFLQKYKQIENQQISSEAQNYFTNNLNIISSPIVILEIFYSSKNAIISNINSAFSSLLGFTKLDLLSRSPILIFSSLYYELYSRDIEGYFSLNQIQLNKYKKVEKPFYFLNKSKYIIPTLTTFSLFQSQNGFYQICQIKTEFSFRNLTSLIVERGGNILEMQSTYLTLFGESNKQFSIGQNIFRIFPTLLEKRSKFEEKPQYIEMQNSVFDQVEKKKQFLCQLYEIQSIDLTNYKNVFLFGYLIKFENVYESISSQLYFNQQHKCQLQFRYDIDQSIFILELQNNQIDSQSQNISQTIEENNSFYHDQQQLVKKHSKKTIISKKKIEYSENIKTIRFFQGQFHEIEQLESEEDDESYSKSEQSQKNEIDVEQQLIIRLNIQNKHDLQYILQKAHYPIDLTKIQFVSNIFMIFLLIAEIIMFVLTFNLENELKNGLVLLATNNQRLGSLLKIQSNLQDIRGCVLGLEPMTMTLTGQRFLKINTAELTIEIDNFKQLDNQINSFDIQLQPKFKQYQDEFYSQNIEILDTSGIITFYQYNEVIQQLLSKAMTLNNTASNNFNDQNGDLQFFLYNSFNSLVMQQNLPLNFYYYYIIGLIDQLNIIEVLFLCIFFGILTIGFIIFQLLFYNFQQSITKILSLFLELSSEFIENQSQKSTQFLSQIQSDEWDDEDIIDDTENSFNEINNILMKKQKKRLASSFHFHYQQKVCQISFLILISLATYFCYLFISSTNVTNQALELVPIINLTSYIPALYRYLDNGIKEMFYNKDFITLNNNASIKLFQQILDQSYWSDNELYVENNQNENVLSQDYLNSFYQVYIIDPCEQIISVDSTQTLYNCTSFKNGILLQGLSIVVTLFFNYAQNLLQEYSYYDPNYNYYNLTYNISNDKRLNYTMNLHNTEWGTTNRKIQKVWVRDAHLYLVQKLNNDLQDHFSGLQLQLTIFLLIFCLVFIFVYFIIWIPFQIQMKKEIQTARNSLMLIPIIYFHNNEAIKQYILNSVYDI